MEDTMKYSFEIKKNIHMYNHLLICTDGESRYEAICEYAPTVEKTLIFWPDDFKIPPDDREIFISELKKWSVSQGYQYIINEGRGR